MKNTIEQQLTFIWADILDHTSFTQKDSFFDVGGHSLLANQLFERINSSFNVRLPVSTIFDYESINRLSDLIKGKQSEIVPVKESANAH